MVTDMSQFKGNLNNFANLFSSFKTQYKKNVWGVGGPPYKCLFNVSICPLRMFEGPEKDSKVA